MSHLNRSMPLLAATITVLGFALTQLNLPLEFLSLWVDFPFNNFLSDLRQGIFYCTLFSFWLIFTGEHLLDGVQRSRLSSYWKQLSVVLIASIALFVFDSIQRGIQGYDPFFTVWEVDSNVATIFLVVALAASLTYFAFLCYHVYLVLQNISTKRNTLPSMSLTRRLIYQGIIYRFKFLLIGTLVCAAFTLAGFLVGQWSQDSLQWDVEFGGHHWEWTSAVYSTVYAMWNCYVITLLILYAPSHKEANTDIDHLSEEIEFSRLNPSDTLADFGSTRPKATTSNPNKNGNSSPAAETTGLKLLQEMASKQAFD